MVDLHVDKPKLLLYMASVENREADMAYSNDYEGPWAVGTTGVAAYAGVYIVCIRSSLTWRFLYIGQSVNIEGRIAGHERQGDWRREAAGEPLHFFAKKIESESRRKQEEQEMIHYFMPPCNSQHSENMAGIGALGRADAIKKIMSSHEGCSGTSALPIDTKSQAAAETLAEIVLNGIGSSGRSASPNDAKMRAAEEVSAASKRIALSDYGLPLHQEGRSSRARFSDTSALESILKVEWPL